jgi:sialate O-acetylesterase
LGRFRSLNIGFTEAFGKKPKASVVNGKANVLPFFCLRQNLTIHSTKIDNIVKKSKSIIMKKLLLLLTFISFNSFAQNNENHTFRFAQLFSNHIVFQRDKPIKIWGFSEPNETIEVFFNAQKSVVQANSEGKWMAELPAMPAGGPHDIRVKNKEKEKTLSNVLIGEVWFCSGQSNMEWRVKQADGATEEIAKANYPQIRHYEVAHNVELEPQNNLKYGDWRVCSPQTVGEFTAVGYYFAKELSEKLNVPIGLIHSSWGGSQVEGWISKEAMEGSEVLSYYPPIMSKNWDEDAEHWRKNLIQKVYGDKNFDVKKVVSKDYLKKDYDYSKWLKVYLGRAFDWQGIWAFRGNYYLQKDIELHNFIKEESVLNFGLNNSKMDLYINGNLIFSGKNEKNISIKIPQNTWEKGKNNVLLKIGTSTKPLKAEAGLEGNPIDFNIETTQSKIPLSNQNWNMCPVWDEPMEFAHLMNNVGTSLYNAMIAPLIPYSIQGAIWYQGESNSDRAYQYRESFPLMIQNWRKDWKDEFPFLFVQLSSYGSNQSSNEGSNWAELREAQTMTLKLPKTGMTVTTDIGNPNDIHPTNKKDVGKRLALNALKVAYNFSKTIQSPMYKSVQFTGNKAVVTFENLGSNLIMKGSELKGFEIAGEDKKFYYAQGKIEGNTVIVSNSNVNKPISVRYGWSNAPIDANLFNQEGLPASPFRTDTWDGITVKKQYER